MSLGSQAQVCSHVFQATVFLFSTAFITYASYTYMDIGCDFMRALAVVFQLIPVCDGPVTCDSLYITNLASDVVPNCCVCQYSIQGLA